MTALQTPLPVRQVFLTVSNGSALPPVKQLEELFERFGQLERPVDGRSVVHLLHGGGRREPTGAFVHYASHKSASAAVCALHNNEIAGVLLRVQLNNNVSVG